MPKPPPAKKYTPYPHHLEIAAELRELLRVLLRETQDTDDDHILSIVLKANAIAIDLIKYLEKNTKK